jgi:hypothetical protein
MRMLVWVGVVMNTIWICLYGKSYGGRSGGVFEWVFVMEHLFFVLRYLVSIILPELVPKITNAAANKGDVVLSPGGTTIVNGGVDEFSLSEYIDEVERFLRENGDMNAKKVD